MINTIPEDATEVPTWAVGGGRIDVPAFFPPPPDNDDDWDAPPSRITAGVIATRAAGLVTGDRDRQHGAKHDNFARIAAYWDAYLATRRGGSIDAVDVGHMMALMKIARTQSGALNVDDYVDGAGYLACAGEIAATQPQIFAGRSPTTARAAS